MSHPANDGQIKHSDHTPDVEEGEDDEHPLSPAEAFALLGNDARMAILQAMVCGERVCDPIQFSDLYRKVDIEDSSKFNYHLGKLNEHFIKQTDEGYLFRYSGQKVVQAVFAGIFNARAHLDAFEIDGECYDCGGPLQAWYDEEKLSVECADCGARHVRHPFPPGGLDDRTPEELLRAFNHYVRHHYCLGADGVCPECMGAVETTIVPGSEDLLDLNIRVDHVCERCHNWLYSAIGLNLLDNPDVMMFHAQRGIDLTAESFWHFDWCVSDKHTTVLSEDPLRVRVDIPCEGDELRITLDDDLRALVTETVCRRNIEST